MVSEYQRQAVLAALELALEFGDGRSYEIYSATYSDMGRKVTPEYTEEKALVLRSSYWDENSQSRKEDLPIIVLGDGKMISVSPDTKNKDDLERKIAEMFPKK